MPRGAGSPLPRHRQRATPDAAPTIPATLTVAATADTIHK
ncbi:hypothetical protein C7S16_7138 [Burkholderia thailandensis]|uniref:Uncharacterized protein n=1 Tax=Burkholderia thailandensis TaxID=57975 RepID=A0AAW9CNF2_BURTH|nr:hypothetical protein [Burkholderia thailandensis]MDW9250623.1 hypothetical protein [Burkholderia thailandensis]